MVQLAQRIAMQLNQCLSEWLIELLSLQLTHCPVVWLTQCLVQRLNGNVLPCDRRQMVSRVWQCELKWTIPSIWWYGRRQTKYTGSLQSIHFNCWYHVFHCSSRRFIYNRQRWWVSYCVMILATNSTSRVWVGALEDEVIRQTIDTLFFCYDMRLSVSDVQYVKNFIICNDLHDKLDMICSW